MLRAVAIALEQLDERRHAVKRAVAPGAVIFAIRERRCDDAALVISDFVYVWKAEELQRHARARGPAPGRRLLMDQPDLELVAVREGGISGAGRDCSGQQQ